ncbi:LD-carboxypeptidase [Salinisphaera sp.]|uniref:S66 peptidase family protein n=1 Tax=Salinisphaera sp. TaxID=1914330 RepID=UPI002D78B538|nr:LD-carboxypeptidase [Salinisphaera sp.]HET7313211.1 LD-carboxypeptidase [Salinisphaera sp.]
MTSESRQRRRAALVCFSDILSPLAGRRVALIAPAGGVNDDRIDTMLAVLEAAGVDALLGAHAREHHRYLAGTAEARLADLHWAYQLPDVAAVWCLRGGYGSAHLVEHIDWPRIRSDVPLIGFSDITVLLEAFRRRGRFAVHAPVATQLAMPGGTVEEQDRRAASLAALVDLLRGRVRAWPLAHAAGSASPVSGRLVGGNLTTLAGMAGTPAALRLEADSILLLEDTGEAEFRLERSFHQLLSSIDRDRLRAVCLGGFNDCRLADGMRSLLSVFAEWSENYGIALYHGLPIGHGFANYAWTYNAMGLIEAGRLEFDP